MEKKELKEYIETKREIKIIEEKIEYLESKKTSIKSMIIDDMPKPEPEQDRLGQLLGEIEELIELYNEKQSNLIKQQMKIEKCIEKLDSALERNIMRLRYLESMKWEKICVEVNYSWENVHRIHRKILSKIK
nr:MAG TPA: DNA directed RNA polymerase subunit [Caudoviricetes sp.]